MMLVDWIVRQTGEEPLAETEALEALWGIVSETSDAQLPDLLEQLTADQYGALVETPLFDQDATELLVRIIDRLNPDADQAGILTHRFPVSWAVSVLGGSPFDVRVLLNGVVLVRNHHRVIGPALWEGLTTELTPELAETITADLDLLRARNTEENASCFLMTHTEDGPRLLGAGEGVDLTAPGWGQTIAVFAIDEGDARENSPLLTEQLREVASNARAGIVFLRFFGDRVDLIPASRFDDDLDVFLEELANWGLCENLLDGAEIHRPLTGEALISEIIERAGYEADHLPEEGRGAIWFREHALRRLAERLASAMTHETVNFGFAEDPDGPRRIVPLPVGVGTALVEDADLRRRSITLEVMTLQEGTRETVLEGDLPDRIRETFEEVWGEVEISLSGYVEHDLDEERATPVLHPIDALPEAFETVMGRIAERAEADGEDLEDAILNSSVALILLIDFPDERPGDRVLAEMACRLSGSLEETVRIFLNGRGEYLAYAEGDVDSGDHELFRLDADDEDLDDEDDDDQDLEEEQDD